MYITYKPKVSEVKKAFYNGERIFFVRIVWIVSDCQTNAHVR